LDFSRASDTSQAFNFLHERLNALVCNAAPDIPVSHNPHFQFNMSVKWRAQFDHA